MADDGGSTGRLRDELGVLPPGDVRQCLVALSESESVMRDLFCYRFSEGGLSGHNFGNIFLSALEKISGSFDEAVRVAGLVLDIRGEVIPVTTGDVTLMCGSADREIKGQQAIDDQVLSKEALRTLRLSPIAFANPKAVSAIERADCVVIGPGNFYCSVMPNLLVRGISEAIARTSATVVFNCNLMTKAGHTDGFDAADFIDEVERHIGRGRIDYVTLNSSMPDQALLARYASEGCPVSGDGLRMREGTAHVLSADIIGKSEILQRPGDPIRRTLIRHDPDALAALIVQNCLGGL
jgi:uncharacterized cofD-like protein